MKSDVFLGTDSGATTSKTGGVWADGSPISLQLEQISTDSHAGTDAVLSGWIQGLEKFLSDHKLNWEQVAGVGLAIPGPYQRYGVLDRAANLPASFAGWEFAEEYAEAIADKAGRKIPLIAGNDGNFGGVAEAAEARKLGPGNVIMLAPGSGLGTAFVDDRGFPLEGDTINGMEAGHMPIPVHLLGLPVFECGCGRKWGCAEPYTTISGLGQYLDHYLPKYPDHPLASSTEPVKKKALSLRGLAQEGDRMALEIFDKQAKAMGLHIASLSMALDAKYIIIGGGLMDPEATTSEFRERYLTGIRDTAEAWLHPAQQRSMQILPAKLGELSQAVGAALMALYKHSDS